MNDLRTILLGEQEWIFLLECAVRASIMFCTVLLLFKFTGKKEVRQFSILELVVLIGLGSALGDPMFYDDVGILPATVAMSIVLLFYRIANTLTNKEPKLAEWLEGGVETVLIDGKIDPKALEREGWSVDDFFGDLRTAHIEHLGQVRAAHIEVDGELSIFFFKDPEVLAGLPIAPGLLKQHVKATELDQRPASCVRCGNTITGPEIPVNCPICAHDRWLPSSSSVRVV